MIRLGMKLPSSCKCGIDLLGLLFHAKKQKNKHHILRYSACSLVALSDIDLNKYDALLKAKRSILAKMKDTDPIEILPHEAIIVNTHGETVIKSLRQPQKQLSDTELDQVVEDYANGLTVYQLAAKFECHRSTISSHMKKRGIQVTNAVIFCEEELFDIIRQYEEGATTAAIARQYKVGYSTILKHLHNNGVKTRSRWDYK